MWIGLLVFAALAVFSIAAVVVGREARRLDAQPPIPSFELQKATAWVAERLPFAVTAILNYEDVRRILLLHLEILRAYGIRDDRPKATQQLEPIVITDAVVRSVREQAAEDGHEYTYEHVREVLYGQLRYLDAIGAVGPVAEGPE